MSLKLIDAIQKADAERLGVLLAAPAEESNADGSKISSPGLVPVIGTFGGRTFQFIGTDVNYVGTVTYKDILKRLDALKTEIPTGKSEVNQGLIKKLHERVLKLDEEGTSALLSSNCFARILTYVRQFFGNLCFNKRTILEGISKHSSQQKDDSLPPFVLPGAGAGTFTATGTLTGTGVLTVPATLTASGTGTLTAIPAPPPSPASSAFPSTSLAASAAVLPALQLTSAAASSATARSASRSSSLSVQLGISGGTAKKTASTVKVTFQQQQKESSKKDSSVIDELTKTLQARSSTPFPRGVLSQAVAEQEKAKSKEKEKEAHSKEEEAQRRNTITGTVFSKETLDLMDINGLLVIEGNLTVEEEILRRHPTVENQKLLLEELAKIADGGLQFKRLVEVICKHGHLASSIDFVNNLTWPDTLPDTFDKNEFLRTLISSNIQNKVIRTANDMLFQRGDEITQLIDTSKNKLLKTINFSLDPLRPLPHSVITDETIQLLSRGFIKAMSEVMKKLNSQENHGIKFPLGWEREDTRQIFTAIIPSLPSIPNLLALDLGLAVPNTKLNYSLFRTLVSGASSAVVINRSMFKEENKEMDELESVCEARAKEYLKVPATPAAASAAVPAAAASAAPASAAPAVAVASAPAATAPAAAAPVAAPTVSATPAASSSGTGTLKL